jgi:hypothetical protein
MEIRKLNTADAAERFGEALKKTGDGHNRFGIAADMEKFTQRPIPNEWRIGCATSRHIPIRKLSNKGPVKV